MPTDLVKGITCPHCHKKQTLYAVLVPNTTALCGYCFALLRFDENLQVQLAARWRTLAETRELEAYYDRISGRPMSDKIFELADIFLGDKGYWYCQSCQIWHEDKGV